MPAVAYLVLDASYNHVREILELERDLTLGGEHDSVDIGCDRRVAVLSFRDGGWWLRALEPDVTVDEVVVTGEVRLRHGQQITVSPRRSVRFMTGERAEILDEIRHVESCVDGLTRLLNRRLMYRALAESPPDAVLMIDVDWMKRINDHFGFLGGDTTLRRIGAILRAHVAWPDLVSRFGGEEFVVLVRGSLDRARALAEQIRVAAEPSFDFEGEPITSTLSIGVAPFTSSSEETLRLADEALVRAKRQGRNRVVS